MMDPRALSYEDFKLRSSDFVPGSDNATQLSKGQIAEIGTAEVQEDGQLSSYDSVMIGQEGAPKLFVDLADDQGNDLPDDTEYRLVARDKNSNRRRPITRWYSQRDSDNGDPRQRPGVGARQPFVKPGRIVSLEVKNEAQKITPDITNGSTTTEFPAKGGY